MAETTLDSLTPLVWPPRDVIAEAARRMRDDVDRMILADIGIRAHQSSKRARMWAQVSRRKVKAQNRGHWTGAFRRRVYASATWTTG